MTDKNGNEASNPANQASSTRWWRSLEERTDPEGTRRRDADEFPEELPLGESHTDATGGSGAAPSSTPSRRDFFKVMGLSATAAMAACQRAPEQKIFPLTGKPDQMIPGVPLWYATACGACPARCGLLVKTRDGRPIKIEGNPSHPVSRGAVCAVGQASLLALYDDDRSRGPRLAGRSGRWSDLDAAVRRALAAASARGRAIRLVVPWGLGPSAEAALDRLLAQHDRARVVRFDPLGHRDAIAAAHQALYGLRVVPDYRLDSAELVASFDADFLGTWIAPARFTRQWSEARREDRPDGLARLRHVQIESNLSLTGAAADERHALAPASVRSTLAQLVSALCDTAASPGAPVVAIARMLAAPSGAPAAPLEASALRQLASDLRRAGARGLVLSGSDDPREQALAAVANALLDNAPATATLDPSAALRPAEMTIGSLATELMAKSVDVVMFLGTNPALVEPRIAAALPHVAFSLSTSERLDETAVLCHAHAPEGHWLEGWSDDRPRAGVDVVAQPTVGRLFDTRPSLTSVLRWSGDSRDDHAFVRARWNEAGLTAGDSEWEEAVRDGEKARASASASERGASPPMRAPSAVTESIAPWPGVSAASAGEPQLVLYASVALRDGAGSTPNNGWLQELPDPLSKVTWSNYAALAPARADALGIGDGAIVEVKAGERAIRLPALRQPGLPNEVVAIAVGQGRDRAGRMARGHGVDAWPLAEPSSFGVRRSGMTVTVTATGQLSPLALTQTHASQEGRDLVREVPAGKRRLPIATEEGPTTRAKPLGLWPPHVYDGHRWGLSVDLDKCTGCGACVVSCSAENNIPIVGEVEVRRRREMHWLRIDRYYGGTPEAPEVLHQPMMCQHCENAPCETVCPVLATVHSSEGLNQQIYNRCVGTRYCANNCPIKTRRFNWFDYDRGGDLRRMVLNPDVVVRSRGVMEKCSLCVHRIEEARALANREARPLADGDIRTACEQSCPAGALVFGDSNDPTSALSRTNADGRAYRILEELNVKAQVTYLARVSSRGGTNG